MTLPLAAARSRTARSNRSSSRSATAATAPAPSRSTRRPNSTSATASAILLGPLGEIALEHLRPDSPRLQQRVHDLPHGAVAAGGAGDVVGHRADLGHGVSDR